MNISAIKRARRPDSTATTKDICSKYSRNQWKTGRPSFSKLSSAKGPRVSARVISRRCSGRWKRAGREGRQSLKGAPRCPIIKSSVRFRKNITSGFINVSGPPTRMRESLASTSSRRASTKPIQSSYHLRPPTRVRNVELIELGAEKITEKSRLRHHHIKTAEIPRAAISTQAHPRCSSTRT